MDYIKAGVEAIIEDEVTSRFEAEELKNWNLLTRTNRYYEFISWRLSIIWVIGFFVRYVILMPFRVIICFVGVSHYLLLTNFRTFIYRYVFIPFLVSIQFNCNLMQLYTYIEHNKHLNLFINN